MGQRSWSTNRGLRWEYKQKWNQLRSSEEYCEKNLSLWLLFLSLFCYSHAFPPSVIYLFSFACNFLKTFCQFWTWISFCGLIQVFSRVLSLVISIALVDIACIGFSSLEVCYTLLFYFILLLNVFPFLLTIFIFFFR